METLVPQIPKKQPVVVLHEKMTTTEEPTAVQSEISKEPEIEQIEELQVETEPELTLKRRILIWFNYAYTAAVSFMFLALLAECIYLLNALERYAMSAEGQVMPQGMKLWQGIVLTIGIHSGSMVAAKLIDWTSSNGESYFYENPLLVKHHQDLQSDLSNPDDSGARLRLKWHSKRFYTFYFVSVAICILILLANKILQVN